MSWRPNDPTRSLRRLAYELLPQLTWPDNEHDDEAWKKTWSSARPGVVSFITTTGFLTGPGFQQMRAWLRGTCSEIWVLHLAPEGHQAPSGVQVFEQMRQPVAIITAVRNGDTSSKTPAMVRYRQVARGKRETKFAELAAITPDEHGWELCLDGPGLSAQILILGKLHTHNKVGRGRRVTTRLFATLPWSGLWPNAYRRSPFAAGRTAWSNSCPPCRGSSQPSSAPRM